jgi:hypothetical protein
MSFGQNHRGCRWLNQRLETEPVLLCTLLVRKDTAAGTKLLGVLWHGLVHPPEQENGKSGEISNALKAS